MPGGGCKGVGAGLLLVGCVWPGGCCHCCCCWPGTVMRLYSSRFLRACSHHVMMTVPSGSTAPSAAGMEGTSAMCICIWQQPAAALRSQRLQRLPVAADDASGCGCSGGAADGPGLRAHMLRGHCGRHVRWQRRGRTNAPRHGALYHLRNFTTNNKAAVHLACTVIQVSSPHDHGAVHNSTQHAHNAHNHC